MKLPSKEDLVQAVIFELNRIKDSQERLAIIIANNPKVFTNEQIKNLVLEI